LCFMTKISLHNTLFRTDKTCPLPVNARKPFYVDVYIVYAIYIVYAVYITIQPKNQVKSSHPACFSAPPLPRNAAHVSGVYATSRALLPL
jgi:hypothetical protein